MSVTLATTLPEHSNDGYVAAAYIVFFAIVLIYVVIMAVRLSRVERRLGELRADERNARGDAREHARGEGRDPAGETTLERETV
jgi:hypothetical protein